MTEPAPAWRFLDHLRLYLPPADIVALPPQWPKRSSRNGPVAPACPARSPNSRPPAASSRPRRLPTRPPNSTQPAATLGRRNRSRPRRREGRSCRARSPRRIVPRSNKHGEFCYDRLGRAQEWREKVAQNAKAPGGARSAAPQVGEPFDRLAVRDTLLSGSRPLSRPAGTSAGSNLPRQPDPSSGAGSIREDLIAAALDTNRRTSSDGGCRLRSDRRSRTLHDTWPRPDVSAAYEIAAW